MRVYRVARTFQRRSGTIYLLVVLSSLIVGTIGLATLQLLRLQGRSATDGNDLIDARLYARTAVELGMLKVRNDPNWRKTLGDGAWATNLPIGDGTYSIRVADPIDNNVSTGNNHPIILTGSGTKGAATYNTSVQLEVGRPVGSALEVTMVSGSYTFVNGSNLTSDQTVAANGYYYAWNGATVNADVEAAYVWGSQYPKSKLEGVTARELPKTSSVFNYYKTQGTSISYSSLPQWTRPEMLSNSSFEANTAGWSASGSCTLARSTIRAKAGSASLQVTGRSNTSAIAVQNLPPSSLALLLNAHSYTLTTPIYTGSSCTARVVLTVTDSTGDVQSFSGSTTNVSSNAWVNLTGILTPAWTGTLTQATVGIVISTKNDYWMDGVTLTDTTYPLNALVIDRKLISPTVNPFGGQTNAEGIYVVNCNGQDVILADSRIIGTLVFVNPGANSSIQRAISWETAIVNYPALLIDGSFSIDFGSGGLSESSLAANFNPTGSPYPYFGGESNTLNSDSYPSKIAGIIYSANDLSFSGAPTVSGVVIADDIISINSTSLTLQYSNSYLNNFPPGFELGVVSVRPVPGTWTRTVD